MPAPYDRVADLADLFAAMFPKVQINPQGMTASVFGTFNVPPHQANQFALLMRELYASLFALSEDEAKERIQAARRYV